MDMPLIQKFRYFSCHILGILSARAVLIKFTFRLPLRKSDESYMSMSRFSPRMRQISRMQICVRSQVRAMFMWMTVTIGLHVGPLTVAGERR